jgi:outer membrane lipoprotein LolB
MCSARRFITRVVALCAALLLAACATQPLVIDDPDWQRHEAAVAMLDDWELTGRLVVRQDGNSDTVNINWRQQGDAFDLRLFGSLGLGAVRVSGAADGVTVQKAGEAPVTLPSLAAVTREYFGYEFPTQELLYWVRGLPAPRAGSNTLDANGMLATLRQNDASRLEWNLMFDRYLELEGAAGIYLPGKILAQRDGLELQFLINKWVVPEVVPEAAQP